MLKSMREKPKGPSSKVASNMICSVLSEYLSPMLLIDKGPAFFLSGADALEPSESGSCASMAVLDAVSVMARLLSSSPVSGRDASELLLACTLSLGCVLKS